MKKAFVFLKEGAVKDISACTNYDVVDTTTYEDAEWDYLVDVSVLIDQFTIPVLHIDSEENIKEYVKNKVKNISLINGLPIEAFSVSIVENSIEIEDLL